MYDHRNNSHMKMFMFVHGLLCCLLHCVKYWRSTNLHRQIDQYIHLLLISSILLMQNEAYPQLYTHLHHYHLIGSI